MYISYLAVALLCFTDTLGREFSSEHVSMKYKQAGIKRLQTGCRRCSNYIFIIHLTLGFNILRKDNYKPKRETIEFGDLVRLILDILR